MSKLITYPTAKLAKEKGFTNVCENYFYRKNENNESIGRIYSDEEDFCERPIQSELQDWLIEKHGVAVLVDLDCTLSWIWKIIPLHPEASIQEQFVSSGIYSTKQLALEEGLFKALTELK